MPLRDHFRPARGRWDALYDGWPMTGPLYAATRRRVGGEPHSRFETWSQRLVPGQPLPTLPL